ncbi:unnamed protein product, partial [Timema podura]|nr:unnamed protein product [Timema podura]
MWVARLVELYKHSVVRYITLFVTQLSEGRALYNLGNIYHAKGKHIGRTGQQDPGEFPEDVRSCLQQAVQYYEDNLQLMRELNETAAQGRACGNLGNTYYLLGNFKQAIHYHEEVSLHGRL